MEVFRLPFHPKGNNLIKKKENMCKKSVVEFLGGNIIQRFENLYDVKKKVLKGVKIKPCELIDVVFGGKLFTPRVKKDGITIEIHADYVSFLWGLIYGSWVLFEEAGMKTELIWQGKSLFQDVDLISRAKKVLDTTLKNRAYSCPANLPNPQKGKSINEQFYIQKVNGVFLEALNVLLLHEVCHIDSGHHGKLEKYSRERRIECEINCDLFALQTIFKDFNGRNNAQFYTSMIAVVPAFASMMLVLKNPLLLNQENHPDLDLRLKNMIDYLDLQNDKDGYYIYKYADMLVRRFRDIHCELYDYMNVKFDNVEVETARDLLVSDIGPAIQRLKFPAILFSPNGVGSHVQFASRRIHGYLSDEDLASADKGKLNFIVIETVGHIEENMPYYIYARNQYYTIIRDDSRYYKDLYKDSEKESFNYYLVQESPDRFIPESLKNHPSIIALKKNPYVKDLATNCYSENLLNDTCITAVFSCPGRYEKRANKPCQGKTGKCLDYILRKLHYGEMRLNRSIIGINNAWSGIEYIAKTERSEASDEEILMQSNIDRLNEELRYTKVAIAFGDKAFLALDTIRKKYRRNLIIIKAIHLSPRRVNTCIKKDVFGTPLVKGAKGNLKKRLSVVVDEIKKASGGLFS